MITCCDATGKSRDVVPLRLNVTMTIHPSVVRRLDELALLENVSRSRYVETALIRYLNSRKTVAAGRVALLTQDVEHETKE